MANIVQTWVLCEERDDVLAFRAIGPLEKARSFWSRRRMIRFVANAEMRWCLLDCIVITLRVLLAQGRLSRMTKRNVDPFILVRFWTHVLTDLGADRHNVLGSQWRRVLFVDIALVQLDDIA